MAPYYIAELFVNGLWGYRAFALPFNERINIIIGPNASGKTTPINLLHLTLTGNLLALSQVEFKEINIVLKAFAGPGTSTIKVVQGNDSTRMEFGSLKATMPFGGVHLAGEMRAALIQSPAVRRRFQSEFYELRDQLVRQVPVVWLPVSRRLPIAEEEEAERRTLHRRPLESVDERSEGSVG